VHVEAIDPHHRTIGFVAVIMPGHAGRNDEVADLHHGFLTGDGGIGVSALHDEAQRRGDVLVRRGDLARQDDLEPQNRLG